MSESKLRCACPIEYELEISAKEFLTFASSRLGVNSLSNASDLMKEPQLLMQHFDLSGESHDQPDTVEINAAGRTEVLNSA